MNLFNRLKFRPDIVGTIFGVLACLCATIYLAVIDSRERYESVLAGQALSISAVLDSRLDRVVGTLRALTLHPSLDNLEAGKQMAEGAAALLHALGGRLVVMRDNETGDMFFDTEDPEALAQPLGNGHPFVRSFFDANKDTLVYNKYAISNLYFSPRLGKNAIIVLVPIVRQNGMVGAMGLLLAGDHLANLVRPTDVPERQFATLLDGSNRIIDRSRGERSDRVGWPVPNWMSEAMSDKRHGVLNGIGMSGVDNMMAFQRLSIANKWGIIVGEPNAVITNFFLKPFLWVAIGGLSALIALSWWILAWRQRFLRDTDILRAKKAQLSRLSRTMPAIQFLCDVRADGTFDVSYIGGDFVRVTGRSRDEVATIAQWDRLRAPDTRPLREVMKAALEGGSATHEFRLSQPDGSWRWLRSEVTRIRMNPDGSGEVVGYIVNVDDTRKAEQRAASAVHLASVGKITSSLANELRRPLSAAHIAAEILEHEIASGDATRAEDRIMLIKSKVGNVIYAHDQLHRFATGRGYTTSLHATSINDITSRVLDVVAPILQEDRIDTWVNIPAIGCPRVMANPVDLEQVLTCLLLNARDAIVAKGPSVDRRVCLNVIPNLAAETVSIKITDNGGGIPAEVMSNLFEPFVTTKREAGNIGLDLSICNALMARMNGAIDARNDDSGAIFTIVLSSAAHDADMDLEEEG